MAMEDDLLYLGQTLKQKRQELNFSLKEVENATSIRIAYLEAIEEGDFEKLISPIYAQGFIKKYAIFLGIDENELRQHHSSAFKILYEIPSEKQEFSFGIGTMEVRGSPGKEVKWLPNFLWLALSVIGILGIWFLARFFKII